MNLRIYHKQKNFLTPVILLEDLELLHPVHCNLINNKQRQHIFHKHHFIPSFSALSHNLFCHLEVGYNFQFFSISLHIENNVPIHEK